MAAGIWRTDVRDRCQFWTCTGPDTVQRVSPHRDGTIHLDIHILHVRLERTGNITYCSVQKRHEGGVSVPCLLAGATLVLRLADEAPLLETRKRQAWGPAAPGQRINWGTRQPAWPE